MFDLTVLEELITHEPSPEYTEAAALVEPYIEKIISLAGFEFYETFSKLYQKKFDTEIDDYFTAGLRLGAQITAALLQQTSKQEQSDRKRKRA